MLMSRIFRHLRGFVGFTTGFQGQAMNSYSFAEDHSQKINPLQFRILESKSLTEMATIFSQNKEQLTGQVVGVSGKTIVNLLLQGQDTFKPNLVKELLKTIEAVPLSGYTDKNLVTLLNVYRNISRKMNLDTNSENHKKNIGHKMAEITKNKDFSAADIKHLLFLYYESIQAHCYDSGKVAIEQIYKIFSEELKKNQKLPVNHREVGFLLSSLAAKEVRSFVERKVRWELLSKVKKELPTIRPKDLTGICISIGNSNQSDFRKDEIKFSKDVFKQVLESITEMEEEDIVDLLRAENISSSYGFFKIYEEIFNNIFAEVKPNGQTHLNLETVIKLLALVSKHINLARNTEDYSPKFFALLERYAGFCREDPSKINIFAIRIQTFIENNFLRSNDYARIVEIVATTPKSLNNTLMYALSIRDINLGELLTPPLLKEYNEATFHREAGLLKLAIAFQRQAKLNPKNSEIRSTFQRLSQLVKSYLESPEAFVSFYRSLRNITHASNLYFNFHHAFAQVFALLPNPLEGSLSLATEADTRQYRLFYLFYIVRAFKWRELVSFLQKHQEAVDLELFGSVLRQHLREDLKTQGPNRGLLFFLPQQTSRALKAGDRRFLSIIFDLLKKYNKLVVYGEMYNGVENFIWRVFRVLLQNVAALQELQLSNELNYTLDFYLTRNHKNYNIEANYRELLQHVLGRIGELGHQNRISNVAIEEGLRLNVIRKHHFQKYGSEGIDTLTHLTKERARCLMDPEHLPSVKTLSESSLTVVVSSPKGGEILQAKHEEFSAKIRAISLEALSNLLVAYNLRQKRSSRFLIEILDVFTTKLKGFEGVNIVGIAKNCLENHLYYFFNYRKIAEAACDYYKSKIRAASYETHCEIVTFATLLSIPIARTREYFAALAHSLESEYVPDYIRYTVYQKLTESNYEFTDRDLKILPKLIEDRPAQALSFFLLLEQKFPTAERSKIVSQIVIKLNEKLAKQSAADATEEEEKEFKLIRRSFFEYLKKVYPQESQSLKVPEGYLSTYRFSQKPNLKAEELLQQLSRLSGAPLEIVNHFGVENKIYNLKNNVFVFLPPVKSGSYWENELLRRLIPALMGQQFKVICLSSSNSNILSVFEYLRNQLQDLLTQEQAQSLADSLKNKREKKPSEDQFQA